MAAPPQRRKPAYLWPFAAILGPMLLLALMAVWTLRADRRSAEQEAKTRAAELATTMLAAAEKSLSIVKFETNGFNVTQGRDIFIVNERFELINPQPWVWPPKPAPITPEEYAGLKTNQLELWRAAEAALLEVERTGRGRRYDPKDNPIELYERLLDLPSGGLAKLRAKLVLTPPRIRNFVADAVVDQYSTNTMVVPDSVSGRLRAVALFRRAHALELSGTKQEAITAYNLLLDEPSVEQADSGESGLSLRQLAMLKILDLAQTNRELLPDEWKKHPPAIVGALMKTPATPIADEIAQRLRTVAPSLLSRAEGNWTVAQMFGPWDSAARAREYYGEAVVAFHSSTNVMPESFWVSSEKGLWLAIRQKEPDTYPTAGHELVYAALPQEWLRSQLDETYRAQSGQSLFQTFIIIRGNRVFPYGWGSSFDERSVRPLMAETTAGTFPIRVSVVLGDPDNYYASVRRRQVMLGSLVVLAVAAGFVAAWVLRRSLLKQLGLNEQKSNFVSSVSHELRAPIASVRLMAESLERGTISEPEKQQEYFRFIGQECRRLSALIANVLDFARIEQGRKQYEFEPTDLQKLVQETVRVMQPYAEERGVKLETLNLEHRTSNVELTVDGHAIQQALVNLIDNAIKHSPAGATVTIVLEQSEPETRNPKLEPSPLGTPRPAVRVSVSDSGPGIPVAEREKIFERFYRLGSELRRETQGVGIGLSIVKHIVEAHGGRVVVESEVGRGSKFTIELPANNSTTDEHR